MVHKQDLLLYRFGDEVFKRQIPLSSSLPAKYASRQIFSIQAPPSCTSHAPLIRSHLPPSGHACPVPPAVTTLRRAARFP